MNYTVLRHKRITISRIATVFLISVCLFTRTEVESDVIRLLLDNTGLILVATGVLGRLWSSMYISGYKKVELVTQGPYALMRNPLYLFSFLGVIGVVLSSQNYFFIFFTIVFFLVYYQFVVIGEEEQLQMLYADRFSEYKKRTPRFIPKPTKNPGMSPPEHYHVNVGTFYKGFLDSIWFFIAYILIDIVKLFHSKGFIPLVFSL